MNHSTVSFEESRQFTRIILDYINDAETIRPFYHLRPDMASFEKMIAGKNYNNNYRPVLVQELREQYEAAGISLKKNKAVQANIELLSSDHTYTVTTGHQLCLYTGPLYFVYKILTTISWCEALRKAHPDKHFIPVFWMASEDHDFAEVNHTDINGNRYTWDIDSNNQATGRITLEHFEEFARQVNDLATNDFARKQLEELSLCYTDSRNLSEATIKLVHKLFGSYGLVILDADRKALKSLFRPYIKTDVLTQGNYEVLSATNINLKHHYKTQVNGRNINFFYLDEKGRQLLRMNKDRFETEDGHVSFSETEVINDIDQHPERYSPNVIMRPLYQELILPNLAYVGGPGEIAYWLQLKDVFAHNGVAFPVLILRNFFMLVKEQHANRLKEHGLSVRDLFMDPLEIERLLVNKNEDGGQKIVIDEFDRYMQQLIDIAIKTDNRISSGLIEHKTAWKKTLLKYHAELDRKQREKVASDSAKVLKIRNAYFRGNTMQERFDNILSFGVTESLNTLIERIKQSTDVGNSGIKLLLIPG